MKKSKINIEVALDKQGIPEKIAWQSDEHSENGMKETKAFSLSIWDEKTYDTLSLQLWTKDMNVEEMKRFYVNLLGGAANTLLSATGDEFMAKEINQLCDKLAEYLNKESQ